VENSASFPDYFPQTRNFHSAPNVVVLEEEFSTRKFSDRLKLRGKGEIALVPPFLHPTATKPLRRTALWRAAFEMCDAAKKCEKFTKNL